jgi:hypothetical protein
MNRFWQRFREAVAPAGLPDVVIASIAGALAWFITVFLKHVVFGLMA